MPYDPPQGVELEVATRFKYIGQRLGWWEYAVARMFDFILEGVRTNGREELSCVYDAYLAFKTTKATALSEIEEAKRAIVLCDNATVFFEEHLKICPDCKGTKHEEGFGTNGGGNGWEDCMDCNGRGVLPKELEYD